MLQTVTAQPIIKRKAFKYHTELQWLENRAGRLESDTKESFRVTSPPEFQGEEGERTPEDLYIGAINSCTMATFLAYAQKKHLNVLSYRSKAQGLLEFADGNYSFTHVKVQPTIKVGSLQDALLAERVIRESHKKCFITNSVKSNVVLEPKIEVMPNADVA
jgi:organic hydroperoxide reductase OsmC/OhrA